MTEADERRRMRGRIVGLALAVLAVALVAAGCGGGGGSDTGSSATSAGATSAAGSESSSGPIVIGESLGESGFLTAFDVPASEGAAIAAEEINAEGGVEGREIVLKKVNNQSDPNRAFQAAKQLIDEGAEVLLGSCNFEQGEPTARAANEAELTMFSYCGGEPRLSQQVGDANTFTFDMGNETNGVGASIAAYAYKLGFRNVFVLEDTEINYSQQMAEFFERSWEELNGTSIVGRETFKNSDASIASQITQIKAVSPAPDAIMLASFLPGGATALRQIRAAGLDIPVITGDGMDGPSLFEAVPNLSDFYETAAASVYGDDPDPAVQELIDNYEKRSGAVPEGAYVIFGYSIIQAIKAAVEKAGSSEGPALRDALETFREQPLLVGPMTFTKEQHVDPFRPEKVIEVQNGKPAYKETVTPETVPNPFGSGTLSNPN